MEEAPVAREEKGPVSVLTMQYRPYNLLGPTLLEVGVQMKSQCLPEPSTAPISKRQRCCSRA